MDFILADVVSGCTSQGYVSQSRFWLNGVATAIGSGVLGYLFSVYKYNRSSLNSIIERDRFYRDGIFNHFGYEELQDGTLYYNKTLKEFIERSFEVFLYNMFVDYLNYSITYSCFEARIQRIHSNLDKSFLFLGGDVLTFREIIHQVVDIPVNDKENFHDFLINLTKKNSSTKVTTFISKLDNSHRRLIFNLQYSY